MSKVLIVTGGSRGIGAAVARLAATTGYAVAVNYRRDAEAAASVVGRVTAAGQRAAACQGDVADEADVVRLFAKAEEALGPVTALVNSAGVGDEGSRVDGFAADDLMRLMAVNVVGTMLCCREAVRRMSTRHGGSGGAIVNVSSMAATIGGRQGRSAYAASKAAVDAFTVGLAREVAREGIRANAIRPGMTLTDMTDAVRRDAALRARVANTIAMNRIAEVDEIARPIVWLLSDAASFMSGACVDASGGGFMLGGMS